MKKLRNIISVFAAILMFLNLFACNKTEESEDVSKQYSVSDVPDGYDYFAPAVTIQEKDDSIWYRIAYVQVKFHLETDTGIKIKPKIEVPSMERLVNYNKDVGIISLVDYEETPQGSYWTTGEHSSGMYCDTFQSMGFIWSLSSIRNNSNAGFKIILEEINVILHANAKPGVQITGDSRTYSKNQITESFNIVINLAAFDVSDYDIDQDPEYTAANNSNSESDKNSNKNDETKDSINIKDPIFAFSIALIFVVGLIILFYFIFTIMFKKKLIAVRKELGDNNLQITKEDIKSFRKEHRQLIENKKTKGGKSLFISVQDIVNYRKNQEQKLTDEKETH